MTEGRRGPPNKKGETKSFNVSLPQEHYDYLTLLATMSRYGAIESDVAAYILIRELDRMFKAGEHIQRVPKPKQRSG